MRSTIALAPILLLFACTVDEAPRAGAWSASAGAGPSCIDATRVAGRRTEGNRTLIFELNDGRVFRNDLQETCPGIERASNFGTLAIDPIEARMCRNDFVRVYDGADLPVGGIKLAPKCRLGAFTELPRRAAGAARR